MKVRLDFVTNSSSSSFIFGEPGVVSGKTKEDIMEMIKHYCAIIIQTVEFMDDYIKAKYSKIFEQILECRCNYDLWIKGYNEGNESKHKYLDVATKLCVSLGHTAEFNEAVKVCYEKFKDELGLSLEDLNYSGMTHYFYPKDMVKIRNIEEFFKNNLYDFKEPSTGYCWSVEELLDWYGWEEDEDDDLTKEYKYVGYHGVPDCMECEHEIDSDACPACEEEHQKLRDAFNYNGMVFKYLGEFGICGFSEGDIPYILVQCLSKEARLSCDHMG